MKLDKSFTELAQPPVGHGHLRLKPHALHLIHRLQRMKTLLKWVCREGGRERERERGREREREREKDNHIMGLKQNNAYCHTLVKRPAVSTALSIWSTLKRYFTHLQLTYLSAVSSVLASSIHLAASFKSPACYRKQTKIIMTTTITVLSGKEGRGKKRRKGDTTKTVISFKK